MEFLKECVFKVNTDAYGPEEDTILVVSSDNAVAYPYNAFGDEYPYYTKAFEPKYVVAGRVVNDETIFAYIDEEKYDSVAKQLAKLSYIKKWMLKKFVIEGDVFNAVTEARDGRNGRYWLINYGDIIATFNATVYRYQSEPMKREWLYSRIARIKAFGFPKAYIVDGFGTRRRPKSVIRVKIVKRINVQRIEAVTEAQTEEVIEVKLDPKVEALIKSL